MIRATFSFSVQLAEFCHSYRIEKSKVYLAAIAAFHVGFGDKMVSQQPLVCRVMNMPCRLLPRDLAVFLDGLCGPAFEALQEVDLKHLSMKTHLLLALVLAKCVGDIHHSFTQFAQGQSGCC